MKHNRLAASVTAAALCLCLCGTGALAAGSWVGGATNITQSVSETGGTYSSSTGLENAVAVSGGTSTLTNAAITKTGGANGESADFYGTNAAVLVYNGATLNLRGGTVTTDGSHANAIFCYGAGGVNASNVTVNTRSNNSGGVMVTGGGTLTATGCTVTTQGNSSAPIRSDRGGGTLTVSGGVYTANGVGSPVIYSTADVAVTNAVLTATKSEGAVVEGKNSITLRGVTLTDTNTTLNGQSTTYKNIFLYQSMSGDASVGTASFAAYDSRIVTNRGDTIYVTNTTATVTLSGNTIVNNDSTGYFLRAKADSWGRSGSNGGHVTAYLTGQTVSGDIYADGVSTISLSLSGGSAYSGAINAANNAKSIALTLDASSTVSLTADSYITSLSDADTTYSNIRLNGHRLYVSGKPLTVTPAATPTPVPTATPTAAPAPTTAPVEYYAIDLSGAAKAGSTTGRGAVTAPASAAPLYVRVTWVYTLSNGDSFAYCAMKTVGSDGTFSMTGPQKPFGATLDAVQTALVTDPNADASGAYDPLALARM